MLARVVTAARPRGTAGVVCAAAFAHARSKRSLLATASTQAERLAADLHRWEAPQSDIAPAEKQLTMLLARTAPAAPHSLPSVARVRAGARCRLSASPLLNTSTRLRGLRRRATNPRRSPGAGGSAAKASKYTATP